MGFTDRVFQLGFTPGFYSCRSQTWRFGLSRVFVELGRPCTGDGHSSWHSEICPKAAQRLLCPEESEWGKAPVWVFFFAGIRISISGAPSGEEQLFQRGAIGTCFQGFPTCNILLVSTEKMKQMQHRNLLDFVFRLGLSFKWPWKESAQPRDQTGDSFPAFGQSMEGFSEWNPTGRAQFLASRALSQWEYHRAVLGLEISRVKKGC